MTVGRRLRSHPIAAAAIVAMVGFAVLVVLIVLGRVPGIYSRTTSPSDWALAYPPEPDDRVLSMQVIVGNTCNRFNRIEVTETPTSVEVIAEVDTIHFLVRACGDSLTMTGATATLTEPIGDRTLTGCSDGTWYYARHFEPPLDNVDCEAVPPFL